MHQPLIIVDCERMKHPNTGLYYYCLYLVNTLLRQQPPQHQLGVYLSEEVKGLFAPSVRSLIQRFWHKFYMPFMHGVSVWHSTYQGTNYYPASSNAKIVFTVHDLNFLYDESKPDWKKKSTCSPCNGNWTGRM